MDILLFFFQITSVIWIPFGVFTTIEGVIKGDYSPEGRHARFLSNGQGRIGDDMYSPSWQNYNKEDVIKTTTLPNGNIENEYKWYGKGGCRSFYEYEPNSGLIVGFRFEEDKKYDCQANVN